MAGKKTIIIAVSLLMAALLAVGGTLAYFTAKAEVTNVVTMGNVKIKLTEPNFDGKIGPIVPGAKIVKDPTITNIGKNDCYVRAKIEVDFSGSCKESKSEAELAEEALLAQELVNTLLGEDAELNHKPDPKPKEVEFDIDTQKWVLKDGYYYYQSILKAGKNNNGDTVVLFNKVTIPKSWGNDYADKTIDIKITAQAVQSDNIDEEKDLIKDRSKKIVGWKNVTF